MKEMKYVVDCLWDASSVYEICWALYTEYMHVWSMYIGGVYMHTVLKLQHGHACLLVYVGIIAYPCDKFVDITSPFV